MPNNFGICQSILEAVGKTPLVKLNKLTEDLERNVYVKLEGFNPGGSIKTRTALNMIRDAEEKGLLNKDSVIVEYTSGNQGIGLSLVSAVLGYKCLIVMPECMSVERKKIIRAYGAEIICTPASDNITEAFELAKKTALELVESNKNYFLAAQFENQANCEAHYQGTAAEIIEQLREVPLHAFVAAIGTGGTITGCSKKLKESHPGAIMVAVEPENSAILTGGKIAIHQQQGIGDGFIPDILDTEGFQDVVVVSDQDAFDTAKRMAKEEGLLVGISSGSNVWAAIEYAKKLPKDSNVVTICADFGDRYLSVENFI